MLHCTKAGRAGRLAKMDDVSDVTGRGEALAHDLSKLFEDYRTIADQHPTSNPLLRLALEVSNRMETGQLDYGSLEALVQHLTVKGFETRAAKLSRYSGETDPQANSAIIRRIATARTMSPDGGRVPFETFKNWAEQDAFGIVITAHPTFEISSDLMECLSALAIGRKDGKPLDDAGRAAILAEIAAKPHGPEQVLDMRREQELALFGINHIHLALRRVYAIVLEVAAEIYPDRWTELTPLLLTVASWVGFDTDGRSDIGWSNAFERRLESSERQLRDAVEMVKDFIGRAENESLSKILWKIAERVGRSYENAKREFKAVRSFDPSSDTALEEFAEVVRGMHRAKLSEEQRLDTAQPVIALLDDAVAAASDDPGLTRDLIVLRAELANFGLGTSHIHARINATQLHNAIRKAVDLESAPDDPRHRLSYIAKITDLIRNIKPVTINFGSLTAEGTSAKHLFMTIAQVMKYIDNGTKFRLLIAECETPFTVLTALYYASLFGIADKVEICPLFETEKALERGSRVIEQLLDNPAYSAYLQTIGKLCVQTGYSDAGRYIGQTPASGSIERLKERVIRLVAKRELTDVQVVFFDTHGDSIGRGGHPDSFQSRLDYVASPYLMSFIAKRGIAFKQETSFQGGDGYLFFQSEDAAFAALTRILEWAATDKSVADSDLYYSVKDRDTVTEFMTTVKEFQTGLIDDADYGLLVGTYGANLLDKSGSRPTRRQSDSLDASQRPQISQFRAIPHNAVLQQLGLFANSISGVGEAIEQNPAWFKQTHEASARLRQMISLVAYGTAFSNVEALDGYIATIDPGLWLARAALAKDPGRADSYRELSEKLEEWGIHDGQRKIYRRLYADFTRLRAGLAPIDPPGTRIGEDAEQALILLHAIRIALIQEIYIMATRIPEFSSRHGFGNGGVFRQILQLGIDSAVANLRKIFPAQAKETSDIDFGEVATYVNDDSQGYQRENDEIFTPMLELYRLIPRISIAIIHYIGAIG
jgi:phosphoenolpyruvate carboxylase